MTGGQSSCRSPRRGNTLLRCRMREAFYLFAPHQTGGYRFVRDFDQQVAVPRVRDKHLRKRYLRSRPFSFPAQGEYVHQRPDVPHDIVVAPHAGGIPDATDHRWSHRSCRSPRRENTTPASSSAAPMLLSLPARGKYDSQHHRHCRRQVVAPRAGEILALLKARDR